MYVLKASIEKITVQIIVNGNKIGRQQIYNIGKISQIIRVTLPNYKQTIIITKQDLTTSKHV